MIQVKEDIHLRDGQWRWDTETSTLYRPTRYATIFAVSRTFDGALRHSFGLAEQLIKIRIEEQARKYDAALQIRTPMHPRDAATIKAMIAELDDERPVGWPTRQKVDELIASVPCERPISKRNIPKWRRGTYFKLKQFFPHN